MRLYLITNISKAKQSKGDLAVTFTNNLIILDTIKPDAINVSYYMTR